MGRRTELIHKTDIDIAYGLSEEEVKQRQKEGLTNRITKNVTKSYGRIIFDNLFNFFNILLFGISIFMIIIKATPRNFIFMYLLIINIAIGIAQDVKARKQTDKLKVVSFPIVHVLRDGNIITIPANEIVLSDIVLISTGDQIVADGTIMEGSIEVNESLLTGESVNILKNPGDNVLSGSYLTSGKAKMRVDRVGKANYAETLQTKARAFKRPKSEILRTINLIFKIIGITAIVLGVATVISYILQGKFAWPGFDYMVGSEFQKSGLALSAMMTSMMPVGMYLFVSITLAVGVIRLARHRVLVQELYCIEMLARADVLCLDKTGTITDGSMRVTKLEFFKKENEYDIENVLFTLVNATGDVNATAKAIKSKYSTHENLAYASSLPFNSSRKMSAVMLKDGRCFVLGAREFLPFKDKIADKVNATCEEYEKRGLRVLVLGSTKHGFKHDDPIPEVTPVCVVVLEDRIKKDAVENIAWFKSNGVAIKIISGDNPISVSEIAKRVGVENADKFISLEGMSLEEVKNIANEYTVFGRVSPEQKEIIVETLQDNGHTVAMTGDGVNDILALKAADCSIAMASGSDAAKAASHLVSLDNNFSSLPQVVAEGRRVINNLQRTCAVFLIKSFFIITFSTVFLLANWFTKGSVIYPFAVNMTNIWELITVGLACFFLSLQPNSERTSSTFMKNIVKMVLPGVLVQVISVGTIFLISSVNPALPFNSAITMAVITFTSISFITIVMVSIPFDVYRVVLSIALGILVISFFIIDCFWYAPGHISEANPTGSFFSLDYDALSGDLWWVLIVVLAVAIPAYFGLVFLARYLNKKYIEKKGPKYESI